MRWLEHVKRAARLMVGVPDYDTYLAHRRAHHPGEDVMNRADFCRAAAEKRFGSVGGRCC